MKRFSVLIACTAIVLLFSAKSASAQGFSLSVGHGQVRVGVSQGYVPYRSYTNQYRSPYCNHGTITPYYRPQPRVITPYYGHPTVIQPYRGHPPVVVPSYRGHNQHYTPPAIQHHNYGYGQGYGGMHR